jgi:hypothetical protein
VSAITSLPASELRAVFEAEVEQHPGWPREFGVAMRDPLVSRLIRLLAIVRAKSAGLHAPSRPASQTHVPALRHGLDFKRLAAGEGADD